jgi:cbb3-type cytochrome oxidase subunit 3
MIRNVLQEIGGVGLYGVISLLLFFLVFVGMLIWVLRLRRPHLDEMSKLPLDGDDTNGSNAQSGEHRDG